MVTKTKYGTYPDTMARYVRATTLVDTDHGYIRRKANELTKECKTISEAIKAIHSFVASLPLGYDWEDLPASKILKKNRGQCNTKTTLFIALARCVGIPSRVHAWYIHKTPHKMHMPFIVYTFTSDKTLFTYPEVFVKKKWMLLSEFLTKKNSPTWTVCPFDDAPNRAFPLKKEWIAQDLGSQWHPDTVFMKFGTNTDGWRKIFFPLAQLLMN